MESPATFLGFPVVSAIRLNCSVISLSVWLMWSSGRFRKFSLHRGQRQDFPWPSQYEVMHAKQKLWPQGVETGLVKMSKQMEQDSCSSDRNSAGSDMVYSRTSGSHKVQSGARGNTTEHVRISAEEFGNLRDEITHPAVNLAHKSSSTNAKGFWNQFLFRGRSDFRYVLPIRDIEIRQETCRALTFTHRITHENCETRELKNNVCFGKCAMAPSSGEDGGSDPCPVCSPVMFGSKTMKLKCMDNTEVIKVITLIEDCQCKTKEGHESHHNGPVLVDPSVDQYP